MRTVRSEGVSTRGQDVKRRRRVFPSRERRRGSDGDRGAGEGGVNEGEKAGRSQRRVDCGDGGFELGNHGKFVVVVYVRLRNPTISTTTTATFSAASAAAAASVHSRQCRCSVSVGVDRLRRGCHLGSPRRTGCSRQAPQHASHEPLARRAPSLRSQRTRESTRGASPRL